MGTDLWGAGSQEGGRVLGQRHVVHQAAHRLAEQAIGRPVPAQLPQQVSEQAVPVPALLDQGGQLGLRDEDAAVGPRTGGGRGWGIIGSLFCTPSPALRSSPQPSLRPEARVQLTGR